MNGQKASLSGFIVNKVACCRSSDVADFCNSDILRSIISQTAALHLHPVAFYYTFNLSLTISDDTVAKWVDDRPSNSTTMNANPEPEWSETGEVITMPPCHLASLFHSMVIILQDFLCYS